MISRLVAESIVYAKAFKNKAIRRQITGIHQLAYPRQWSRKVLVYLTTIASVHGSLLYLYSTPLSPLHLTTVRSGPPLP